jgi:uncharacterized protein involved in type VI secretion and phage assembly
VTWETASSATVLVNGTELADDQAARVYSVEVDQQLGQPARCILSFMDADSKVIDKIGATLGAAIKIKATSTNSGPTGITLFDGEITAFEFEHESAGSRTIVRAYDRTHRMQRGRVMKGYVQSTYGDVVRQVIQAHGLAAGSIEAGPMLDLVLQAGETDYDFLSRLARELGFVAGLVDGKFQFGKPPSVSSAPSAGDISDSNASGQLVMDVDIVRFRASVSSSEQVSSVQVRSWDAGNKTAFVSSQAVTNPYAQGYAMQSKAASAFGTPPPLVVTNVPLDTASQAQSMATGVAAHLGGSAAEIEATVHGNPALKAGQAVNLANVGTPFDGKYVLTGVQHRWQGATYFTEIRVDGTSSRSLWGLGGAGGRPSGPSFPGVVPAVVTNMKDPKNQGRAKLKFPWLSDEVESNWARVALMGGGSMRGSTWLPEVDDEVLVAFEQGDIRRPYILGGLNNSKDALAVASSKVIDGTTGKIVERALVSRAGHSVAFSDGDSDSKIKLTTKKGMSMALDDTNTKITISSTGEVSIEGATSLSIKGSDVTIEASQGALTLKGQTGVNISSQAGSVKIDGVQINVSGQGPVAIKGAIVQLN